jgi:hypothetical protein
LTAGKTAERANRMNKDTEIAILYAAYQIKTSGQTPQTVGSYLAEYFKFKKEFEAAAKKEK